MDIEPKPRDYSEETALAQRVARIFGYDGLIIDVKPGAGWQTIRGENDITLVVDPDMLQPQTLKDASGGELPADTKAPEQYSIYGIAHELGHVDDFIQPESDLEEAKKMKPSEHFFWNLLDDGVINNRLRNIPLLNSLTDEVYKDMLFPRDDYAQMPKHTQLMYGWLLRNVTPNRSVTFSGDVTQALDGLSAVEVGGQQYDLYRTLTHPDTDYGKRREIAKEHILPIYESFLEEDRQQQQDQQSDQDQNQQSNPSDEPNSSDSSQGGSGESQESSQQDASSGGQPSQGDSASGGQPTDWDEIYDAYGEASHCGHKEHHEEKDHDHSSGDAEQDPHDAIKEAADAIKEAKQEQADQDASAQQVQGNQAGEGAGSIAAELQLSLADAIEYQKVVERYRTQIQEVAKVLQQLTVPSVEYTSPRYQRRADTSGLKLSPRDLFQVVVAHHTNVDPAVWKPVETISKKEGYSFNGLDIHLVIDSSGSMQGAKADTAAACSVILMEGLASARRIVQRYNTRAPKPDVRLQVVLFGSGAQVVAPLGHETEAKDKGVTFTTVRDAASGSTYVADALKLTVANGKAHPERTQLVYLITDGDFHDRTNATNELKDTGANYFLYQYVLLSPHTTPITTQSAHLNNPNEMPNHMNKQLRVLASRFLVA